MTGSDSLSIGEMLDLLKVEFPDVTISKIRFLESQGLLDPERTASGYRKFYPADVERLRWILRQQRENFLPLKVIKGRLEAEGVTAGRAPVEEARPTPETGPASNGPAAGPPADTGARREPGDSSVGDSSVGHGSVGHSSVGDRSEGERAGPTYSRDELARASSLTAADMVQLERHGLLVGSSIGGQLYYDEEAMVVARLAAAFARHGVEPRHLRMYKIAAEREAGFYEQVVLPLLKQRNPGARQQALDTLAELSKLGGELRAALLRGAMRAVEEAPKVRRRP